jgi:hypothetical protein
MRRRGSAPVLVAAWIVVMWPPCSSGSTANASYRCHLFRLALLAAAWGPFRTRRYADWMLVVLAAAFLIKANAPHFPGAYNYHAGTAQPTAPILSSYCSQARGNQLIILDMADDLYASALPPRACVTPRSYRGGTRRPLHHAVCRNWGIT